MSEEQPRYLRSLRSLQIAQAFGAFNDNAWKMIVIALATRAIAQGTPGAELETQRQSMFAFVALTLPLAVFSLPAGGLADRCRKNELLFKTKVFELVLMIAGTIALFLEPRGGWMPFAVLSLMGVMSAIFSPAKYGILPEIVPHTDLSRANGRLELATFVAIIAGTVFGTQLLSLAPNVPGIAGVILVGFALLGTAFAKRIERTEPARLTGGFLVGFKGAKEAVKGDRLLQLSIIGQAWFWSVASLLGQDLVVYGKTYLKLSESTIGIPLGMFGIGVGLGSELAGRAAGNRVEMGFVPLGATFLSLLTLALGIVAPGIVGTCVLLLLLGIASGFIVVPLNSLQQWRAPEQHRGAVISLSNTLAFSGMLVGSLLGYWLALLGVTARGIVCGASVFTLLGTALAVKAMPIALLRGILLVVIHSTYRVKVVGAKNVPSKGGALLAPNHVSFIDGILLSVAIDRPIRFIVDRAQYERKASKPFMKLLGAIPVSQTGGPRQILRALKDAGEGLDQGEIVCIFPEGQITRTGAILPFRRGLERIVKGRNAPIIPVHLDRVWGSIFSFSGGRFGKKLPEKIRYPVTITFGRPLPQETPVAEVRRAVVELASQAWFERKADALPLHRAFLKRVRRRPFSLCLTDSERRDLSRLRTAGAAVALARALRTAWFAQERVGILLPPSVPGVLVNLAAALSARVAVNLNYTAGKAGMESAAKQSGLQTVLTSRLFLEKAKVELPPGVQPVYLEDVMASVTSLQRFGAAFVAWLAPARVVERYAGAQRTVGVDDVFTIIFSSGSTGEPKGVMLTHFNIDSDIEAVAQVFRPASEDRILGVLPLFHSFGTMVLWFSQLRGMPLVCHNSPLDAEAVGMLVLDYRVTLLLATPTFLSLYLRRCTPEQFGSLRIVMAGAEKLTDRIADAFAENFGIRPLEGYGATECAPVVAASVPPYRAAGFYQAGSRRGFVGPPIPCMTAKVIDPDAFEATGAQNELPFDTPGLLLVRGPNVMKGYLGRDDLTAQAIRDGWYVTGDIAAIGEDGFIRITDRLSRFSKIGGEMVPHGKVEEALQTAGGLTQPSFVVTAIGDAKKGERLAVLTTLDPGRVPELLEKLAQMGLPNLFIPRRDSFVKVEAIPVLGTGKVDLRAAKRIAVEKLASDASP